MDDGQPLLAIARAIDAGRVPITLDEKLVWVTRFGRPHLALLTRGWWSRIEMHVSSHGSTFTIESDSKHETPTAAVDLLIERMVQALKDLGVTP